ncbi:hypothetical protein [Pseudochelatococcus sp. G4_1912]|uniref:hypothetical protein n=1 Tax=Pseudochelatococcus sp. G4_1912 TaxID=3114288 RepID=UPI0039C5AC5A
MTCVSERVARHDLTICRGDSTAIIMRFRTLSESGETVFLDLTGSDLTLTIDWPGGRLLRQSSDGGLVVDALVGTVTWSPQSQDTLAIPDGRIATYRMVRDILGGERRTLLEGFIIGMGFATEGGVSSDV